MARKGSTFIIAILILQKHIIIQIFLRIFKLPADNTITSSYKFLKNNNNNKIKWKPSELQKNLLPRVFKSLIFSIPILLTDPLLDARDTFHFGKMQQSKKGMREAYPHFFLLHERAIVRR